MLVRVALVGIAGRRRRGGLAVSLLVHALHLAVLALHPLAAFLAVVLALLVLMLVVIHPLMLGMSSVRIGGRSRLGGNRHGDDERERSDKRLHVKFSKAEM